MTTDTTECEHGDPRPGRCALCRQRVRRQTHPERYADTTPLPPRRRRRTTTRLTSAAVSERGVWLWCDDCGGLVPMTGRVFSTRSDAPVHVTPDDWSDHRAREHAA